MSIFMSEVTNRLGALPLVSVCLLQVVKINMLLGDIIHIYLILDVIRSQVQNIPINSIYINFESTYD